MKSMRRIESFENTLPIPDLAEYMRGPLPVESYARFFRDAERYMKGFTYGIYEPLAEYSGTPLLDKNIPALILPNLYTRDHPRELYWCRDQSELLREVLQFEHPNVFTYFVGGTVSPFFSQVTPGSDGTHLWILSSGTQLQEGYNQSIKDLVDKHAVIIDPVFQLIHPVALQERYTPIVIASQMSTQHADSDERIYEHRYVPLMLTSQGLVTISLQDHRQGFTLHVNLMKDGTPLTADIERVMTFTRDGKRVISADYHALDLPRDFADVLIRLVKHTKIKHKPLNIIG